MWGHVLFHIMNWVPTGRKQNMILKDGSFGFLHQQVAIAVEWWPCKYLGRELQRTMNWELCFVIESPSRPPKDTLKVLVLELISLSLPADGTVCCRYFLAWIHFFMGRPSLSSHVTCSWKQETLVSGNFLPSLNCSVLEQSNTHQWLKCMFLYLLMDASII